jgi:hypothetical protein
VARCHHQNWRLRTWVRWAREKLLPDRGADQTKVPPIKQATITPHLQHYSLRTTVALARFRDFIVVVSVGINCFVWFRNARRFAARIERPCCHSCESCTSCGRCRPSSLVTIHQRDFTSTSKRAGCGCTSKYVLPWHSVLDWALRTVQIEFESLSFAVKVPVLQNGVTNIGTTICGVLAPRATKTKAVLSNCSGVLSPGTLTLVRTCKLYDTLVILFDSFPTSSCLVLLDAGNQR